MCLPEGCWDMKFLAYAPMAALVCMVASPARAADDAVPVVLEPSSPWNVDFADDSCSLRRQFGIDGDTVYLELRQFAPGSAFQTSIVGLSLNPEPGALNYQLLPDFEPRKTVQHMILNAGQFGKGVIFDLALNGELIATERAKRDEVVEKASSPLPLDLSAVNGILVSNGLGQKLKLDTGPMDAPFRVLKSCMVDLIEHWGLKRDPDGNNPDQAKPENLKVIAKALWSSYPTSAVNYGISAIVRVRLMVGRDGRPTSCHIQIPAQAPSFEEKACKKLMKIAKFEPPKDSNGEESLSYWVTKITYRMN